LLKNLWVGQILTRPTIYATKPEIIAQNLLAFIPELGTLTRRQIASLAGLAPKAHDSGKFQGYRHTAHGRDGIKPFLFLAAMAARNSNSPLKAFYENLIARGKKKMVALTALMRKIIVIANARLKPLNSL
jgi:transposase